MPGAPRQEFQMNGVQLHFLRLEDESGDRAVVWLDPARTPIPAKGSQVQLVGEFRRFPVRFSGGTNAGDATIGLVRAIR